MKENIFIAIIKNNINRFLKINLILIMAIFINRKNLKLLHHFQFLLLI